MKRSGEICSCPWLFIYLLFSKGTVPLGETSSKSKYFTDDKHGMDNFCTTETTFKPIPHGVFWITHKWGERGQILPTPYNSVSLKDMDLKFCMLQ